MSLLTELATLHTLHATACKVVVDEKLSALLYAVDAQVGVPLVEYLMLLPTFVLKDTDCEPQKFWLVGEALGCMGPGAHV